MIEYLLEPYKNYPIYQIFLEIFGMITGVFSVWLAKKNNILLYPVGLLSTSIYVFLSYQWQLFGDMLVNFYYSIISIIGWLLWSRIKTNEEEKAITKSTSNDYYKYVSFFIFSLFLIVIIYKVFNKFDSWYSYVDTFTSALFFVAMWAMAKRKLEHWLFWILGNMLTIPLYLLKGLAITSFQYLIFLIIAINGYLAWRKIYNKYNLM